MDRRARIALFSLGALAVASCGTAAVSSPGPRHPRGNEAAAASQSDYVAAGGRITATLESTMDTSASLRGQEFVARLDAPLVSAAGRVVAPAGAALRGRVVSLGTPDYPRVRLVFDGIETASGTLPLRARVVRAEHRVYAGPRVYRPTPMYDYYSSYALNAPYGNWGATGGGPLDYNYESIRPREVHLARGSRLELELTRPLVLQATAPGTAVPAR